MVPFESLSFLFAFRNCIISEIKRDMVPNRAIFHTTFHSTLPLGGPRRNVWSGKPEWCG